MTFLIPVIETIGAWLLFAAPLLQATTELHEEVTGWEAIRTRFHTSTEIPIKQVSLWWWLLPPVKIILERRKISKIKQVYADVTLSDDTHKSLRRFSLKANGWIGVTLGGWLVAISTTWELVEKVELGTKTWVFLLLLLTYTSILFTIKLITKASH
ncbi:MAG: hypothetical protein L0F95_00290 [Lactococcus sp.]|uniref:Uncharacterized protein n=2 Tax=Pseudolactococcus TaxID=3436058 RepID=A0A0D6DXT1_9LACT|nr:MULTISPECIES: hypothetical protein [Lactococcus]MCJ1970901.1 hypothetical protein [Lactococcus carnosus]MCJ1988800.1 hypothetical protein [Lactococcus carnosus]MDN5402918.1 hypothetical protein [Lactococcus sp.]MDN5409509.1 hypothetical protein [Lactococcus sp.]MDN5410833.1 hypothetical protein [Lactococcus sp.]